RKATDGEKQSARENHGDIVVFRDPDMKLGFGEIGHVAGKRAGVLMQALTHQDPSHVGPPFAIEWGVGIAFFIRELMMNAMCRNPENRSTFERKSGADGQEIFHPLRSFVSPMSQ